MSKRIAKSEEPADLIKRTVDLGREEELVTWDEWFKRAMEIMSQAIPKEHPQLLERLAFRVSLADGRVFAVRQVLAHVARGKCTIGPSRWNEREAICDVITGYVLVGAGEDEFPSAMCVPPTMIASVECVLVPSDADEAAKPTPFGFYKRDGLDVPTQRKEIEEPLLALSPI